MEDKRDRCYVFHFCDLLSELRLAASCGQSGLQVFRERFNTSYKIFHPWLRLKAKDLQDALARRVGRPALTYEW
jgi:hypothetical protein